MIRCTEITLPPDLNLPPTLNVLWLPETPLAACLRAVVLRDTRGVLLSPKQRLNHVAVSPYFNLTWFLEGSGELLSEGQVRQATAESSRRALPGPILLMGPTEQPFVTYNPGPVRTLMLVFMPDALHHLVGLDSREWIGRSADAREVLPLEWQGWLDAVLNAPSETEALEIIENFLNPRWATCRPASLLGGPSETGYKVWPCVLPFPAPVAVCGRWSAGSGWRLVTPCASCADTHGMSAPTSKAVRLI